MRLTLRTLLAWLDDTLSPAEVRQIGQQVAESPFAQELVEKIHRVTRQRRLTVPSASGPDPTDPNIVADYLDSALGAEEVAEFEKRCLTSDVHLAEVASVHQILSLIGQKAKVPAEARERMYGLVKGREAVASGKPHVYAPPSSERRGEPAAPWSLPELRRRPWLERFGPAVAVVALIALLGVSAYRSIGPRADLPTLASNDQPPANPPQKPAIPEPAPAPAPVPAPPADDPEMALDPAEDDKDKDKDKAKEKDKEKVAEPAPAKGIGEVGKTEGILLRFNDAATALRWEVVPAKGALRADDRLVGLAPFRVPLQFGAATIELVRGAEVRPHAPEPELAATFDLARGQVVVQTEERGTKVGVGFNGRTLTIAPGVGVPVGLERVDRREPGESEPLPVLMIYVPEGEATLTAGAAKETVNGPAVLQFRPPAIVRDKGQAAASPAWVTETAPTPLDAQIGAQFAKLFAPGKYPSQVLNEAVFEEQKDLQRLAIQGVGAIEDYRFLAEIMSTPNNPPARRAAIAALRAELGQSSETSRKIREALQAYQTPDWAHRVEKLLSGFTPKETRSDETYATLVKELKSPDVGLRELALENLRALTGRDRLDYSPDKPEGDGLKAWEELLKEKKLRPQAPRSK